VEHDIIMATAGMDRDRPPAAGVAGEADADVIPAGASSHEDAEARARPSLAYVSVPPPCGPWPVASPPCSARPCPRPSAPSPARWTTSVLIGRAPSSTRPSPSRPLGGLTLPDDRPRTLGGVFFHLVRASDAIRREDKDYIFPRQGGRSKRAGGSGTPAAPAPPAPAPVAWTDATFRALARQLQQDPGRATTVKITVIGRPCTIVEQGQAVALALVSEKVPDLPKGLPEPPAGTRYTVFVARKQWGKIAEVLAADPEDAAIIEGYAALDPRVDGIAVYVTSATTKLLQAAKRAATAAAP